MKSQFIKVHELRGKDNVPGHIAALSDWAGLHSKGTGGNGSNGSYKSLVDQDTVEQRVAPLSIDGGYGVWDETTNPLVHAMMRGPVSPNASGLTPYATLYADRSLPQPLQLSPLQQSDERYNAQFYTRPFLAGIDPSIPPPQSQPLILPAQGPATNVPLLPVPGFPAYGQYQQVMDRPLPTMLPSQPPIPPGGKRGKKKRRFPIWARVVVCLLIFLILVGGSGYAYYQVNFSRPITDITGQQAPRLKGDDVNPNQNLNGNILSGSRINILLLGSDTDQKFGNSANGSTIYLAQTDIVVSIDPASKQVAMLSIPRDFYINIPGYGMGKLDEAFAHGYSMGPGGFPGAVALSRLTIYQDFGIPINYYAWVGLDGFIKVINTVGGVDVDVLHPITDDAYPDDVGNNTGDIYAYRRLYIPPGPQHLSGTDALNYVRSRHADLVGDFGRSARQQQVLSALKTKLANPDIIGKLSEIANDLDGYVKTDMQLPDILKLMNFARGLDPNKVQRIILDTPYSSISSLPSGESIVEPNCAAIVPEIAKVFQLGNQAHCNITATSNSTMLASASAPAPGIVSAASASADVQQSGQGLAQVGSTSALSLLAASAGDNMLGFHSILDLLLAVVFESPQAMQV